MYRNHTIKAVTDYPVCDSDNLNYFKLNNMYYESYDAATLMEKMKESYQKKEDSFTCEFSNPDVYAQARECFFAPENWFFLPTLTQAFARVS